MTKRLFGNASSKRSRYLFATLAAGTLVAGLAWPVISSIGMPATNPNPNKTEADPIIMQNTSETPQNEPSNSSQTQVTVNGQNIPVPNNGEFHTTLPTDSGVTKIDISAQNSVLQSSTRLSVSSSSQVTSIDSE